MAQKLRPFNHHQYIAATSLQLNMATYFLGPPHLFNSGKTMEPKQLQSLLKTAFQYIQSSSPGFYSTLRPAFTCLHVTPARYRYQYLAGFSIGLFIQQFSAVVSTAALHSNVRMGFAALEGETRRPSYACLPSQQAGLRRRALCPVPSWFVC